MDQPIYGFWCNRRGGKGDGRQRQNVPGRSRSQSGNLCRGVPGAPDAAAHVASYPAADDTAGVSNRLILIVHMHPEKAVTQSTQRRHREHKERTTYLIALLL